MNRRRRRIAILGGGLDGWLAAAMLARALERERYEILVLEPKCRRRDAASVATTPLFRGVSNLLAFDEKDLMRCTRATFKLGAQFKDWGRIGDCYFSAFGPVGARLDGVPFHQHWLRLKRREQARPFDDYSPAVALAHAGRFAPPVVDRRSPFFWYSYGYHFDSQRLANYLRQFALQRGVTPLSRDAQDLILHPENGSIRTLRLDDGADFEAHLYIDCTAARDGMLFRALGARFEDWHRWLPCDRALSLPQPQAAELPPYSQFIAAPFGWRWQIPLQDAVDCGYAYCSDFATQTQVETALRAAHPGKALEEPTCLQLECGRPDRFWIGNCIFLGTCNPGLLESTRMLLLQSGIMRLLAHFPNFSPDFDRASAQEYNRLTIAEHDAARDLLALHFSATTRDDSPYWDHCREAEPPPTLRQRMDLFRSSGRLGLPEDDCFGEEGWIPVLLGQNIIPDNLDPLTEAGDIDNPRRALEMLAARIHEGVQAAPSHRDFLARHELLARSTTKGAA